MTVDQVRRLCLSFPHTTESVQWGSNLVFKIAGKMYAVADLEPSRTWLGFKCTPEEFAELVERPGIVPAPYLARAHWASLETADALPQPELHRLLRQAYDIVTAKLPKKVRDGLR
ncbi:MAG: MmcQ/YjbR family DNA-binding protein [Bryobacteraceae bacterium]